MIRALDLRLRPSLLTLGLCLAIGCGGESKPAAKSPTPQASPKASDQPRLEKPRLRTSKSAPSVTQAATATLGS